MRAAEEIKDELIIAYKNILPTMDYKLLDETANHCALICCDKIIKVLDKLSKPEYTTFIEWEQLKENEEADTWDGYEYTAHFESVKQLINELK